MSEENLRKVIAQNIVRITKFTSNYKSNESEVRRTLVEPVLEALGWDVKSLEDVRSEVKTEDGQFLDYMLRRKGKDLLVLETKSQSEKLEKHLNKLAVYCSQVGVSFGVITDGAIWILFKAFEEGVKGRDRIVFSIDTTKDDANVNKLLRISKNRIDELTLLKEQMLTFQEVWDKVVENPDFIVEALQPSVAQLLGDKEDRIPLQQEDLTMFLREQVQDLIGSIGAPMTKHIESLPAGKAGPKGTMWIDTSIYPIRRYKDILVNTAEWLIESGHLTNAVMPIQLGPTRFLINSTRSHPEGKRMISPKKLSNGLFLETNASSYDCERWARKLMGACGIDESRLRVERTE